MPRPEPCLGYPSRSAAVLALRERGLSHHQIAARTGIPVENIGALYHSARRSRDGVRSMPVQVATLKALAPAAEARGLTIAELVDRLLGAIADGQLVDAVLDDGGKNGR